MDDQATEVMQQLLEFTRTTQWIVTIQLFAAVLMIVVEACLLYAIIKTARLLDNKVMVGVDDLIAKMQYLTLKVEVILEEMGWQTTKKFLEETSEGVDVDEATARALHDARIREELLRSQKEAGLAPEDQ